MKRPPALDLFVCVGLCCIFAFILLWVALLTLIERCSFCLEGLGRQIALDKNLRRINTYICPYGSWLSSPLPAILKTQDWPILCGYSKTQQKLRCSIWWEKIVLHPGIYSIQGPSCEICMRKVIIGAGEGGRNQRQNYGMNDLFIISPALKPV